MRIFRLGVGVIFLALLFGTGGQTSNAAPRLTRLSRDIYSNTSSQHRTQVEPDTFSFGSTIVAAFQSGRFFDGGASNIGWATSSDGGETWTHGFLPKTTGQVGGPYARISDPSVTYDVKHGVWLINTLGIRSAGQSVLVSRSTNGGTAWGDPIFLSGPDIGHDKNWVTCDNTASSPHYGNCYVVWDSFGLIELSISSDGGVVWSAPSDIADTSGLGVQPLALPNGTAVIPYFGFDGGMYAVRSMDGGVSWNAPQLISQVHDHFVAGNLRSEPLPSADVDRSGTIYLVWQDCRAIKNCRANDLVMTTSSDGVAWSAVKRIPLDPKKSGVDHFIPGIAADPETSGATAHLALTYYYYDETACNFDTCRLNVGFATSTDGGATWSPKRKLAGPMNLAWLPDTSLGHMVGDYISTSVIGGRAFPVFAVAKTPTSKFRESMFAPGNGLAVRPGSLAAVALRGHPAPSDHPLRPVHRLP